MFRLLMLWAGWLSKSTENDGGPGAEQSTVWDELGQDMDPNG